MNGTKQNSVAINSNEYCVPYQEFTYYYGQRGASATSEAVAVPLAVIDSGRRRVTAREGVIRYEKTGEEKSQLFRISIAVENDGIRRM